MSTDPAVTAAAEAIYNVDPSPGESFGEYLVRFPGTIFHRYGEAAVAAARPIIEAEHGERIAAEVRAWCHEERHGQEVEGDHWITVLCGDCEDLAARIARGQA